MKKVKYLFWFLSIIIVLLSSCTHEDQDDSIKFLKKIVETSDSGTPKTTFISYDGNKIVFIDNEKMHQDFYYTGDLITAITTTDKVESSTNTVTYKYQNENLIEIKSSNKYLINYMHNSDGTVTYEKFDISVPNVQTKLYHGTLYFKNNNLVEENRLLDNTDVGTVSKYNVTYAYDGKKNPYYSIEGFYKLLDFNDLISQNNFSISTVETTVEKDDQIISSASFYKNTIKYSGNYPNEKNSIVTIPDKGLAYTLKTEYFY